MRAILRKIYSKYKFYVLVKKHKKCIIDMAKFLSGQGVHILYVELPKAGKIKGLTEFEKERISFWTFDSNQYKEELPKLKKLYGEGVTKEYIDSVFDGGVVVQGEKRRILLDFQSENQHIINGRRITVGQPKVYHNRIYTHGACTWRGTGVEDYQTIASYLQKLINAKFLNSYKVINSAIGRGSTLFDDFQYMKEQEYDAGDIVVVGSHGKAMAKLSPSFFHRHGIQYIETSSAFNNSSLKFQYMA